VYVFITRKNFFLTLSFTFFSFFFSEKEISINLTPFCTRDEECHLRIIKRQKDFLGKVVLKTAIIHCSNCNAFEENVKYKRCSRCTLPNYCSKECQKVHWKAIHKANCGIILEEE
jgi:uncharacterized paraquat-inducible protein A